MKRKIVDFLITKIVEIRVSFSEHEREYAFFPYIAEESESNARLWEPGSLPMSYTSWSDFIRDPLLPAIEEFNIQENVGEYLFEITFSRKIWRQLFSLIYHSDQERDDSTYLFEVSEAMDKDIGIINKVNELIALIEVQEEHNRSTYKPKCNECREIVVIRLDKNGKIV